jgi:hypothetical protein
MNTIMKRALEHLTAKEQRKIEIGIGGGSEKYHKNRISAMNELAKAYEDVSEKKLVYVCSPYAGDILGNTERARKYAKDAISKGALPFVPHLMFTQIYNDGVPSERGIGCALGLEMLDRCDELWVYGDTISAGMKAEMAYAEKFNIPVVLIKEGGEVDG